MPLEAVTETLAGQAQERTAHADPPASAAEVAAAEVVAAAVDGGVDAGCEVDRSVRLSERVALVWWGCARCRGKRRRSGEDRRLSLMHADSWISALLSMRGLLHEIADLDNRLVGAIAPGIDIEAVMAARLFPVIG